MTILKLVCATIKMATCLHSLQKIIKVPLTKAFSIPVLQQHQYQKLHHLHTSRKYRPNDIRNHAKNNVTVDLIRMRPFCVLSSHSKKSDQDHVLKEEIIPESLTDQLRTFVLQEETDGILKIAPSLIGNFDGEELIFASLEATNNNKGQSAGILNSIIASGSQQNYYDDEEASAAAALSWDVYSTWEELADDLDFYPNLVTFCCVYSSVSRGVLPGTPDELFFEDCKNEVMDRAQRYSKKLAGSKRRKSLNAISRRGGGKGGICAMDRLDDLKDSYGNDFDILYEDDDVVVVNKPSGMVCFHSRKTTDGKIGRKKKNTKKKKSGTSANADISLEDALVNIGLPLSTLNHDALGIVHRIDRGTSGCIVLAKNNDAHARLVTQFFTRQATKRYIALVSYKSSFKDQNLESVGVIDEEVGGRPAKSLYRIQRAFGKSALQVEVETRTGRKHQVRIHCSKGLGRPIFLDPTYSVENIFKGVSTKNQKNRKFAEQESGLDVFDDLPDDGRKFFLHAHSLNIEEFAINVTAQLPDWWLPILDALEISKAP